jgi:hypothetical protein
MMPLEIRIPPLKHRYSFAVFPLVAAQPQVALIPFTLWNSLGA